MPGNLDQTINSQVVGFIFLALASAIPASALAQAEYQYNHPLKPFLFTQSNANVMIAGKPADGPEGPMRDGAWLVSGAGVRDVFENITQGGIPTIRHTPSGLVCVYPRIVFSPKRSDPTRFDPANLSGCTTRINDFQVDTEVGSNIQQMGIRSAMSALIGEVELEEKGLSTESESVAPTAGDPLNSARASAQLVLSAGDEPRRMYLSAAAIGDWVFITKTRCWSDQTWLCRQIGDLVLQDGVTSRRP